MDNQNSQIKELFKLTLLLMELESSIEQADLI